VIFFTSKSIQPFLGHQPHVGGESCWHRLRGGESVAPHRILILRISKRSAIVDLAASGQAGHRCHTVAARRAVFAKQKEEPYEKQSAVLAWPNQGRAFFGSFCRSNDVVSARIGSATSPAISAFHKPAGFRFLCLVNRVASDSGRIYCTDPPGEFRIDDYKLGECTDQLWGNFRGILL